MRAMPRHLFIFAIAASLGVPAALAEDRVPAVGRIELGAFPGGGVRFTRASHADEPSFTNYTIGASCIWNASERIGIEGEAYLGLGGHKSMTLDGRLVGAQPMPDVMAYSAVAVFRLAPAVRGAVPYGAVGLGALQLLKREGTESIGVTDTTTLFTRNIGGGVKWYAPNGWGLRADYRMIVIARSDSAPQFFGLRETRYAHRVYAGIFTTF
jgi:outer membrane protein with beta-barrel domain